MPITLPHARVHARRHARVLHDTLMLARKYPPPCTRACSSLHPHYQGPYLPWFSHPTPGSFSALAYPPACTNPPQGQGACLDSQGPTVSYTSPLGSAPGPASLSQHTPVPLPSVRGPWNGAPCSTHLSSSPWPPASQSCPSLQRPPPPPAWTLSWSQLSFPSCVC